MTTSPQSGKDLLAKIRPTRAEEKVHLCLRPDLIDAFHEKDGRLEQLKAAQDERTEAAKSSGSQGSRGSSSRPTKEMKELAAEVLDLEKQIMATSSWFTLRSTDRATWQALCDRNPPRDGFIGDMYRGFNVDATLDDAVKVCLVDPVFAECEDEKCTHVWEPKDEDDPGGCGTWQWFEKVLNPSEWIELREATNRVNASVVEPPKSALASQILRRRDSASERPAATG